jgi:F-type H+-transporting ATPase subunit b
MVLLSIIASGGQQALVDFDATLFIQAGVFLLVFLLLRSLLFSPVIRLIEMRRKATEGNRGEADKFEKEAKEINRNVQEKLDEVRAAVAKERDQLVESARVQAREMLAKAREESHLVVEQAKEDTAQKAGQVREKLQVDVISLVDAVAIKVLGRVI